jgi:hypothetical protein
MYRVTVTQDPKEPSRLVYQNTSACDAFNTMIEQVSDAATTCVVMHVWNAQNDTKLRGRWETKFLFKKYR